MKRICKCTDLKTVVGQITRGSDNRQILQILGTFIATDQLMRIVDDPSIKEIDIFNVIYQLRKERRYMVQSSSQYVYVYKCVLEYMKRKERNTSENKYESLANL